MIVNESAVSTVRLATLDQLSENHLRNFLDPVPCKDTLREMFDRAGVPRFKANPKARRGGGIVYYSVAAVEKLFRSQTLPPVFSHKVNC